MPSESKHMAETTDSGPRFARLGELGTGELRAELEYEHELRVRAHVAMDRMAAMVAEEHGRRLAAEAEADDLHVQVVGAEDEAEELRSEVELLRSEVELLRRQMMRARREGQEALRELEGVRALNDLTMRSQSVGRRRRVVQRARHAIGR